MDINQIMDMAKIMVKSGYFKGLSPEQIAVRIMRGQEVGIPPVAAVMGLDDVRGKLGFAAHTMAAMVQRSGKYSYHIKETTDQRCLIQFFRGDELIGESEFTLADAERAGLPQSNQQYQRYPKAMLYNRALSQGVKMYCPDVSLGPVYETSELEDFTENIQEESRPIPNMSGAPTPEPKQVSEPISDKQLGMLRGLLNQCGVIEGNKTKLISAVYPQGITKREASDAISLIKDGGKLIGSWANVYTGMLTEQHGHQREEVAAWMKDNFGTNKPATLTSEQQKQLFAWIADDIPEPEPQPQEDAPEPTQSDWVSLARELCESAGVTHPELTAWAVNEYAPDSGATDLTELGSDTYAKLRSINTVTIKAGVDNMKQNVEVSNG